MKLSKAFAATLLIAILSACASEKTKRAEFFAPTGPAERTSKQKSRPAKPPFTRAKAENDVCEAVVGRFAHDASVELKTAVSIVFLGFTPNKSDPDPDFLKRFSGKQPRVLPLSSAIPSPENRIAEKQTGKPGVSLRIERVDWIDLYNVEVPCAWSSAASNELTFVYQLTWKKGKWVVM